MPTTILVEPNPGGHRSQSIAAVAEVAGRTSAVLVLTSRGARQHPSFQEYAGHLDLRVVEKFDSLVPTGRQIARDVADLCRTEEVDKVVLMDADQALKSWWHAAPRAFGMRRRPRVVFMLIRYPARQRVTDWVGWKLRVPKALLALAAMASGSLHRVAGYAGRDDLSRGWIVRRVRDFEVCTAHSRDRAILRSELDLPGDRPLVGIFGGVNERKNVPLIWQALHHCAIEADLLLAGGLSPAVAEWLNALTPADRSRIHVRDGFLSNEVLDKLVATADVVPLAMTLNGPSGIMGKAVAAGVPVVTAGSEVRAREVMALDVGAVADLNAESIGRAIEQVLTRDQHGLRREAVPVATAEEYAATILGPAPRRRRHAFSVGRVPVD